MELVIAIILLLMPCKLSCVNQKVIVAVENLRQMPIYQWNYAPYRKKQIPIINVLCFLQTIKLINVTKQIERNIPQFDKLLSFYLQQFSLQVDFSPPHFLHHMQLRFEVHFCHPLCCNKNIFCNVMLCYYLINQSKNWI